MTRAIRTTFEHPPIPVRHLDWSAVFDGEYDGAPDAGPQRIGRGETEAEAITDLLEQHEPETDSMTQGRWYQSRFEICAHVLTPNDPSGIAGRYVRLAEVTTRDIDSREEAMENARVMAAAPGLLRACQLSLAALEQKRLVNGPEHDAIKALRVALSEATGTVTPVGPYG